jgi:mono/diheme cytochrome c family protein
MFDPGKAFLLVAALTLMAGCLSDRHSSSGFRLPADGDIERGKVAFATLGCSQCHVVAGADLPEPAVQPPVPVVLGGQVPEPVTDGYLVTAIIYPAYQLKHQLARYRKEEITRNGQPRMPQYEDRITARQLTDIVAFLQSTYTVQRPIPEYFH